MPDAVLILGHIFGIVHCFVLTLDDKAHVDRIQRQIGRGVAQSQTVVESPLTDFAQDQVRLPSTECLIHKVHHRDFGLVLFGGAPDEFVTAGTGITQPDAGDEVRGLSFEGVEVAVEGQQDEDVLLRVAPMSPGAMRQQPVNQFGYQVALRVVEYQCV